MRNGRISSAGVHCHPIFSVLPKSSYTCTLDCECSHTKMAAISPAAQIDCSFSDLASRPSQSSGLCDACSSITTLSRRFLPSENKPQYITQAVEDSLKVSTLDKLLDSPNFSIQETTAIIVCERALHDGATIDVLLWYITRPDHELREKGIRALTMMMNSCDYILPSISHS